MFKSYQTLAEEAQTQSSDDSATILTFLKSKLNEGISKCYAVLDAEYFYTSATDLTVDGQSSYPLPFNCQKLHSLKITISSVDYVAVEFPGSENQWIALTGGTGTASENTYPTYYFVKRNTYEIWPTSSTDDYTMTIRYKRAQKDLSNDDYTTETIKTATNGSTAIVGNTGTAWTAAMAGRYLKITDDGEWYEISSVTDATNIVLSREFAGTSIAAGTSAYTIGEMSLIPEPYQEAPIDYALWRYYMLKQEPNLAAIYKANFENKLQKIEEYGGNLTTSGVLTEDIIIKNPNDYPSGLS